MAEAAREAEERGREYVEDVLRRAGHTTCPAAGSADVTTNAQGRTVILCGCYEVFDAPSLNSPTDREFDAQVPIPDAPPPYDDEPPWEVDGTATEVSSTPAGPMVTPESALEQLSRDLAHVDPHTHYTPEMLEQQILDVVRRIDAGTLYESELIGRAYATAQAYELAFAKARARSEGGAADDRKAAALVSCEAEFNAMTEAEMMKKIVAAAMHNLRASLSGYQSVLRSIGASYQTGGSPGPNGRR